MFDLHNFFKKGSDDEIDKDKLNEDVDNTEEESEPEVSEFDKYVKTEVVDGRTVYKYRETPDEPEYIKSKKSETSDEGEADDNVEDQNIDRNSRSKEEDDDEYVI